MRRLSLLCLALVTAIAGCGDAGSNTPNSSTSSGTSQSDDSNITTGGSDSLSDARAQDAVSSVLIDLADLPGKAEESEPLPLGFCDPLEILDTSASQAAKSPMFAIGQIKLQEAVGIFPARGAAEDAYDALLSAPRVRCIEQTIVFQGELQGGVSVSTRSPNDMDAGDEAQSMVFEVRHIDTGEQNSVEVASVRSGNSVASLIFLNPTETRKPQLTRNVVGIAADRLAHDGSDG